MKFSTALHTQQISSQGWKCVYESKCEINVKSRRFCQLCRLEKCFRVGMRKEWILKDDEKQERKEKILKNKEGEEKEWV